MNRLDLIIDNIMYAKILKESAHQDELLDEALAAAHELKVKKQAALDKKADNARELGLNYEPEQEPVCDKDPFYCWSIRCQLGKVCKQTALPRKEWVGLTNEELVEIRETHQAHIFQLMFAVEAKLKEKNSV